MSTITKIILIALAGASLVSLFAPIVMPETMISILKENLSQIWIWNGILPIDHLMIALHLDFYIILGFLIWKILFGTANGKPEID